jgi:hypothetical protein
MQSTHHNKAIHFQRPGSSFPEFRCPRPAIPVRNRTVDRIAIKIKYAETVASRSKNGTPDPLLKSN